MYLENVSFNVTTVFDMHKVIDRFHITSEDERVKLLSEIAENIALISANLASDLSKKHQNYREQRLEHLKNLTKSYENAATQELLTEEEALADGF